MLISHINNFSQDILIQDLRNLALSLKESEKRLFEYLYRYFRRYDTVNVSQIRMAKDLGYCRQTVNEGIRRLTEIGFIAKITKFKQTCHYMIHPDFKIKSNLKYFVDIFVSFLKYAGNVGNKLQAVNPTLTNYSSSLYTLARRKVGRLKREKDFYSVAIKNALGNWVLKTVSIKEKLGRFVDWVW